MVTAAGMWRSLGALRAVAFVALVVLASANAMAAPPDDLVNSSELATPPVGAAPSIASWQRLAANALLVPLLEPDGPLAWGVPNEIRLCREDEVSVDGGPLPYGQRIALGRPFVVRFRLNDCWPLGADWIGLSGTLEMSVLHEGPRLSVTVRPLRLSAAINGVRVPITAGFTGAVALDAASTRP